MSEGEGRMTDFEQLLNQIDAERIAHNDYFKANESNLDLKRLYGFERRIHDMFDAAQKIIRAAGWDTPEAKRLQAIAAERAKLRPERLRRDPKVIREEARQHVQESKRSHKEFLEKMSNDYNFVKETGSTLTIEEWKEMYSQEALEEGRRQYQAMIDKQGGQCTTCGEPLDADEQLVARGRDNTLICETCTVESMEYHGDPIL